MIGDWKWSNWWKALFLNRPWTESEIRLHPLKHYYAVVKVNQYGIKRTNARFVGDERMSQNNVASIWYYYLGLIKSWDPFSRNIPPGVNKYQHKYIFHHDKLFNLKSTAISVRLEQSTHPKSIVWFSSRSSNFLFLFLTY